eukprot:10029022-Alexandrium_andersonii.AAC.1
MGPGPDRGVRGRSTSNRPNGRLRRLGIGQSRETPSCRSARAGGAARGALKWQQLEFEATSMCCF